MIYYIVFFFVILGEPVIVEAPHLAFSSMQACRIHGMQALRALDPVVDKEPESGVTAMCLGRDLSRLGKS